MSELTRFCHYSYSETFSCFSSLHDVVFFNPVLLRPSPMILPVPQRWSGPPRPSPWSPCSSSSPPSSSATSDTSGRSAPSSPSCPGSSSSCQVRALARGGNDELTLQIFNVWGSKTSSCSRGGAVLFLFCAQTRFANNHKVCSPLVERLQAPGFSFFSCHALFPYFPIILLQRRISAQLSENLFFRILF